MLLHTKETAATQYFKGALAIPHRQTTFQWSMLCCALLYGATDRQALLRRRADRGFSLKALLFPPPITLLWENYTGKTPLPHLQLKDAMLHDWNCQIKHTVGGVSKQVFKKNDKTFLMEMIDRLFTKKCEFSWCLEMSSFCMRAAYFSLVVVVVLYNWSRPLNKSCCLKGEKSDVCSSYTHVQN